LDPVAIAQLPLAALLILIGMTFFGLLVTGQLRFKREVEASEKVAAARLDEMREQRDTWKEAAQRSVATGASLVEQNERLTEVNERLIASITGAHGPQSTPAP